MNRSIFCLYCALTWAACDTTTGQSPRQDRAGEFREAPGLAEPSRARVVRFATFNAAMHRRSAGQLLRELRQGNSRQAQRIAEIVQRVRPDVLLINEIDHDAAGDAAELFWLRYLHVAQADQLALEYPYRFTAPVNTGEPTGHDLDNNDRTDDAADCFGYGEFPGQYGMAVYARYPFQKQEIRTFQKFLWQDIPGAELPRDPATGQPFYDDAERTLLRLSSKSHWDVPIAVNGEVVHFLVCHPTPPVFDGPEDRNGLRNRDEIRLWADYIDPQRGRYLYDDTGRLGGLPHGSRFVIAGDLNADPFDGSGVAGGMDQLLGHPLVHEDVQPRSAGAVSKASAQGGMNARHRGDPALDTGDFPDQRTGNLRVDYVLPSRNLKVIASGVFWPAEGEPGADLVTASDHRLVWVDVRL